MTSLPGPTLSPLPSIVALMACLLTVVSLSGHAQTGQTGGQRLINEMLRIENRSAERIRETIAPRVAERGDLGRIGNVLIITTTRENLQALEERIAQLDTPPAQLRLTIDFAWQDASDTGSDSSGERRPYQLREGQLLRIRYRDPSVVSSGTVGRVPVLELAVRARLIDDSVELEYGFGPADQTIQPQRSRTLAVGQWQPLTAGPNRAESAEAYLRQLATGIPVPLLPQPPVALRIERSP